MNRRLGLLIAFCACMPAHSSAQQKGVFGFNSLQLQQWYRFYGVPQALRGRALAPASGPGVVHVLVSGNFGATFHVMGAGSASSSRSDSYIDITTNRGLTFQASSFTILQSGGAAANTAGSITYEVQLYAGTSGSVGAAIGAAVSGTDTGFNGATLTLSIGSIPGDNHVVLRLSRTVAMSQLARGGQDYSASGAISVTIN